MDKSDKRIIKAVIDRLKQYELLIQKGIPLGECRICREAMNDNYDLSCENCPIHKCTWMSVVRINGKEGIVIPATIEWYRTIIKRTNEWLDRKGASYYLKGLKKYD